MNWNFLTGLLKAPTSTKPSPRSSLTAGFIAARDVDETGSDDILAGCLLSISASINAYAVQDNNEH